MDYFIYIVYKDDTCAPNAYHTKTFESWQEYHWFTFDPDIDVRLMEVNYGRYSIIRNRDTGAYFKFDNETGQKTDLHD